MTWCSDMTDTGERIVYCVIVMGGLVVFATMIGLISNSIEDTLESLSEGKTKVLAQYAQLTAWHLALLTRY